MEVARAALGQVLGVAASDDCDRAGPAAETGAASVPAPALAAARHPMAMAQNAAIEEVKARENALDRSYFPRFNLEGTGYARGTGIDAYGATGGGASGLGPNIQNWALGMNVTFPAFDLPSIRARKQVEHYHEMAEAARYDQVIQNLNGEMEKANATLAGARRVAENTPIQLEAARATEQQATARYKAGLGNIVEVAEAQRILTQAEIDDALATPEHLARHAGGCGGGGRSRSRIWSEVKCAQVILCGWCLTAMRRPITILVAVHCRSRLFSMLAIRRMPVDIFPEARRARQVFVAQPYGGMDPAQMEGYLTYYYEYHFLYITGIEHVESKSIQGVALMKLAFHEGTDMSQAMAEVVGYVNRARSFMPPGAVPPFIVRYDAGSVPVAQLVFSSANRSPGEMQDIALNQVRPIFATLPGVSAPPPFGGNQRTIVIRVDPERMRAYRISPEEAIEAVNHATTVMPSGNVRTGD